MARFIIHTHDGACPTNVGSVIQYQQVGTIHSLSSLTLPVFYVFFPRLGQRIKIPFLFFVAPDPDRK